jgi:hypothetical protein
MSNRAPAAAFLQKKKELGLTDAQMSITVKERMARYHTSVSSLLTAYEKLGQAAPESKAAKKIQRDVTDLLELIKAEDEQLVKDMIRLDKYKEVYAANREHLKSLGQKPAAQPKAATATSEPPPAAAAKEPEPEPAKPEPKAATEPQKPQAEPVASTTTPAAEPAKPQAQPEPAKPQPKAATPPPAAPKPAKKPDEKKGNAVGVLVGSFLAFIGGIIVGKNIKI